MGLRLTTTWKCNCQCKTCHIWEIDYGNHKDLAVEEIDRLTRSKYFRGVEYITLSGGEPTLRQDLPNISPSCTRISQGRDKYDHQRDESPGCRKDVHKGIKRESAYHFRFSGLSLNGPPQVHDATRGVKGAFEKVMETYDRIKEKVPCRFSFTFCRENVEHFKWYRNSPGKKERCLYMLDSDE